MTATSDGSITAAPLSSDETRGPTGSSHVTSGTSSGQHGPAGLPVWDARRRACTKSARGVRGLTSPKCGIYWALIFALVLAALVAASPASASDKQVRATVKAGYTAIRDHMDEVQTCPDCLDESRAMQRTAGAYMNRLKHLHASTRRGEAGRLQAFQAFKGYALYAGDLVLANLSPPEDEHFYRSLAAKILRGARGWARRSIVNLQLSDYP